MKGLLFLVAGILLFAVTVVAHEKDINSDNGAFNVSACVNLSLQAQRVQCYSGLCAPSYPCAKSLIIGATDENGPVLGLKVLSDLMESRKFSINSDGHELAHIIGRQTAKHFGVSGKSFLSCPSDYNYGCQHGFFEYALSQSESVTEAATSICENLPANLPRKDKFYCYHGVGHGVMMAAAYNLNESLSICDSLPSSMAAEGCWQGLFMENVNGQMLRRASADVFDKNDPLAPCDRVNEKYQRQCYMNHAGYLMGYYNGSFKYATTDCLKAAEPVISVCIQGLGLMTTNPGWQKVFTSDRSRGGFVETAISLCTEFPKGYEKDCLIAAVDNLLNFNQFTETMELCSLLKETQQGWCYERIGVDADNLVASKKQKMEICSRFPEEYKNRCQGNYYADKPATNTTAATAVAKTANSSKAGKMQREISNALAGKDRVLPKDFLAIQILPVNANVGVISLGYLNLRALVAELRAFSNNNGKAAISPARLIMTEEYDSKLIFTNDTLLRNSINKFTLASITKSLSRAGQTYNINCHDRAHELGRTAYEVIGNTAFKECGTECHSGCLHGAMEAFFADKGTANIEQNLKLLCNSELNGFFLHQCVHGVGHGLMAWSDYDLPSALKICDSLPTPNEQSSCWTGVFMENIVGGIARSSQKNADGTAHITRFLNDDLQYPCDIVEEKYKGACYFLQSSRILQITKGNFSILAKECAKAPAQYHLPCFESMGRDASGFNGMSPEKSISVCNEVVNQADHNSCITGAINDQFWDANQAPGAIKFCQLLEGTKMEANCYALIIARASDVMQNQGSKKSFCAQLNAKYQETCLSSKPSKAVIEADESQSNDIPQSQVQSNNNNSKSATIVQYTNSTFAPAEVRILSGQTVTWANHNLEPFWPASNIHPTHAIYPEFDAKRPVDDGKNWSFTFTKKGVWRYHDHLSPEATGTVIVD